MDGPVEVMISALEHFSFCPRQCGLIHVEQTFDENVYTIRGRLAHEAVDAGDATAGPDPRVLRGIPLWSERLGLRGRADVVELRRDGPYPIEYRVGPPRGPHASIQLCAQALCLEARLSRIIDPSSDSLRIYRLREPRDLYLVVQGRTIEYDIHDPMIL